MEMTTTGELCVVILKDFLEQTECFGILNEFKPMTHDAVTQWFLCVSPVYPFLGGYFLPCANRKVWIIGQNT